MRLRDITARKLLIEAFELAGYVCPEARRQAYKMRAQDIFRPESQGVFLAVRLNLTQSFLKAAGYDIHSDEPYRDVLGLKGGRDEFEAMMPEKYRTAKWLSSLKPREPS